MELREIEQGRRFTLVRDTTGTFCEMECTGRQLPNGKLICRIVSETDLKYTDTIAFDAETEIEIVE